ncbi:hypothetical protein B0H14DRAFT_2633684 [Mycena olivaceomarginata]|nr:hypothetical protein B0H14DRAFT_2633684 [Mycena olivaceomarginata]
MAQKIFAIVIGIDQYKSKEISNLQGCVRDAASMQEMLSHYSPDAQISSITDAEATRAGILQAFEDHLLNNPCLKRNDVIVVYFAGKGRRLPAPEGASGRDVDILTFILDASFSFYVPRGNVGHRSDTSVVRPSHVSATGLGDVTRYTGFFSDARPSYVLLAACQQHQLAYESPHGGAFTHELVKLMRQKRLATYRELANALKFEGQDSFCAGLHADRILFSAPQYSEIPKLCVFLDSEFH